MMQLLDYIVLLFDSREISYKLYFHPYDGKYHFRPDAVITLSPAFVAWRLERGWAFGEEVPSFIRQQLTAHLDPAMKKADRPLL